jgi:phosphoenolpyruvate carboxylase
VKKPTIKAIKSKPINPRAIKTKNDADLPLREDIRYLGRVLGDTIREQAGGKVFDLVERIRGSAIHYRRDQERGSLHALEKTIGALGQEDATNVVRAFSYFHHLANVAEDVHHDRLTRPRRAAWHTRARGCAPPTFRRAACWRSSQTRASSPC